MDQRKRWPGNCIMRDGARYTKTAKRNQSLYFVIPNFKSNSQFKINPNPNRVDQKTPVQNGIESDKSQDSHRKPCPDSTEKKRRDKEKDNQKNRNHKGKTMAKL
jgi:hypothetical protein